MNIRECIDDIMYSIYHTHNYDKNKKSIEENQKISYTENLISDMIIDLYGINTIYNDAKYKNVKNIIINEYNYQINNKNDLGHTLLDHWPLYKRLYE